MAATVTLILVSLTLLVPAYASSAVGRAANSHPIYIGQIASLTGPLAASGILATGPGIFEQAGTRLAARQINQHGGINGRPLKLILADDQSTNAGGIAAFGQLVKTGEVTAIIGPTSSVEIQGITSWIRQAGLPVMIGGTAPLLTHEGDPWVFRTRPSAIYASRALATFGVRSLHLTRIAILHATDVGGVGSEAALLTDLKALGMVPPTDQSFTEGGADKPPDLTAQVLAIKKSGARALISQAGLAIDCIVLARQMQQVGLHLTWLGNAALAAAETRQGAGALLYGTYAVTDYVPGQSPESAAFDRYSRAVLHLPGDFASAYAYDGVQILARVMRKVGTNPQAIRRGILAIRGYRGAMGNYNFDRNGDGLHQYTVVQNVQGRLRVVKVLSF